MKVLVIKESCFGNTSEIADRIAVGLRSRGAEVTIGDAEEPPALDGVDLLVIGAPTHGFTLPGVKSRLEAQTKWGGAPPATGVAEWIAALANQLGFRAAAFDTAMPGRFTGSASKAIAKRLRSSGIDVIARESFLVSGREGPLSDGELDRAELWGATLAESDPARF